MGNSWCARGNQKHCVVAITMRLSAIIPQKSPVCDWNDAGRAVFHDHGHQNGNQGMSNVQTGASSTLFGKSGHTSVSRGLGEFHGRRPVLVTAKGEAILALPVEGLDGQ